jgi:hypothetical protein
MIAETKNGDYKCHFNFHSRCNYKAWMRRFWSLRAAAMQLNALRRFFYDHAAPLALGTDFRAFVDLNFWLLKMVVLLTLGRSS